MDKKIKTEKEVAFLLQGETSDKDIARILNISRRTVQAHLSNIYVKLDVFNRAEAIVAIHEIFEMEAQYAKSGKFSVLAPYATAFGQWLYQDYDPEIPPYWSEANYDLEIPLRWSGLGGRGAIPEGETRQIGEKLPDSPSISGQEEEKELPIPEGDELLTNPEEKLSGVERTRLVICRQAIKAKEGGTTFKDFCAQRSDIPTPPTLRRWIRELKTKGITKLT